MNDVLEGFIKEKEDKEVAGKKPKSQPLSELIHRLPEFKQFYFEKLRQDIAYDHYLIVAEFNDLISPDTFFPKINQYDRWRAIWNRQIVNMLRSEGVALVLPPKMMADLVPVDTEGHNLIPKPEDLEGGAQTLAGKLLNDANQILESDIETEEFFTTAELMKRKTYVLSVMNHVARIIQADKHIAIRANAEKRETVNFMMELMKKATAGKINPDAIGKLKKSYVTVTNSNA